MNIIKHIKMILNYRKIVTALEVSWYAMEKYAPNECSREINTSREILKKIGSL